MVLLGASLLIASLSICAFHWRPAILFSWTRHLSWIKGQPPPITDELSQPEKGKSQRPSDRSLSPSIDLAKPSSNDITAPPRANTSDWTALRPFAPDSSNTPKAFSRKDASFPQAAETPWRDSKGSTMTSETPPKLVPTPSTLMPPPPRPFKPGQNTRTTPSKSLQPPPSKQPSPALRPPTLRSSPNRTASLAPGPRSGLAPLPTTSTLPAASRPRKKVILSPGRSPLDWAHLISTSPSHSLSGVTSLQRVTPSRLKIMNGRKGRPAWSSYKGRVYNIAPYLPFHPGGEGELMRGAGKEAGKLFEEIHPWVNWESMLGSCMVGILVGESETAHNDDMDDMD